MDADEPIPMPANYNWQDAIKQAANSFVNKKTAEALPEAWEQYLMKKQMNIAFSSETEHMHKTFLQLKKFYEELILQGRKLSGEPEDFNFWAINVRQDSYQRPTHALPKPFEAL